ncbi:MAG: hypothetical protein KAX20_00750 [Candidatus Omnitrophica bacterium]|nr:hypothetical protein [Candidatus Omnitrophota bacterium]
MLHLEELTYSEIAKHLRIKEGTVKSRLFKAKRLLRGQVSTFDKTFINLIVLVCHYLLYLSNLKIVFI